VKIGLERILEQAPGFLQGQRLGLLMNQASVDNQFRLACDLMAEKFPGQLKCLFSPQHGIWGEQQANMIETAHGEYRALGIPIYSLYSETRRPTASMLDEIDQLVIDLQDVGTRVYTFIWTMLEVMKACADVGKSVVILDRPNPLGGVAVEGKPLEPDFTSFVGGASIPLRHGLTMAELASLFQREFALNLELHLVPMEGWKREWLFGQTGRHWLWPSPNIPSLATTLVYPGQVLLEGTNLSEGRGSTRPFEIAGGPYVEGERWIKQLNRFELPGVRFLPTRFQPTFDKWQGLSCQGLDIQVTDPVHFQPVRSTAALLAAAARLFPEFQWLAPPYEYELRIPPIDILYGSEHLRKGVEDYRSNEIGERDFLKRLDWETAQWNERQAACRIY
jgi:uncharacterized protein YbbC (DUF1343 family)